MPDLALDGRWEVGLTEIMYPKTQNVLKEAGVLSVLIHRSDDLGKYKPVKGNEASRSPDLKVRIEGSIELTFVANKKTRL